MRVTKFRVRDKKNDRWVSPNVVLDYSGLLLWSFGGSHDLIENPEIYDVQFFTGLKDKNGKEIFEGDIVGVDRRDSFSSYNKAVIVYADNHGSFLLSYTKPLNPNGFLAKESITSNDKTVLFDRCTGWELEVIGNIYGDKDLLT